jgi:hypothetical protein
MTETAGNKGGRPPGLSDCCQWHSPVEGTHVDRRIGFGCYVWQCVQASRELGRVGDESEHLQHPTYNHIPTTKNRSSFMRLKIEAERLTSQFASTSQWIRPKVGGGTEKG